MNHTRFFTLLASTAAVLVFAALHTTPAAAQAAVESPEGGRDFASLTAAPLDALDTTPDTPTPAPDPEPVPDPDLNPCGEYSEDGPHPCPGSDDADPTPTPPQDGELLRR
jgi:hypothetical protein